MHAAALTQLACPIDGMSLQRSATQHRCASGHSFDTAREGYCNLLVVQHKASLDPGDSKDMVAARRRVLDAGHYAPIADHLFHHCIAPLAANSAPPLRIVDAGCGEGYYLDRIAALANTDPRSGSLELAGIDVSKWAIKAAARRLAPVTWLVANNRQMPFPKASVDIILCVFGFPIWEGFKPVQRAGQHIILVDPGADHLLQLREVIYPTVQRAPAPTLVAAETAGYRLVSQDRVCFATDLHNAAIIQDLTAMTPHAYRMPPAGREALAQLHRLKVTVDVTVRLLVHS
jgi:23S rRNA (guanine745-N1)-methyltransferase